MKSKETLKFERLLFEYLQATGTYCIFECQIGYGGGGKVDCMAFSKGNIISCYEIKVTKSDFHSKHGHNFKGNFNYYVMPLALYEQVKDEIPAHVGVLCEDRCNNLKSVKKAKSCLMMKTGEMKEYMLRSLYREYQKYFRITHKDCV